ncbi:FAD-binding protein [Lentzea sp. NBRC 105346]|uniref:FAD-dependent oxidoreductase n=1 Tax=Lentzea sp. NBRC 105346 TaxID=3032205 RepID=UPI0024A573DC|nr:FAD-dependent oxidoreductase [Lentzea sp. NBRC 105346]GLZ36364.1 FAD-binding protein [Lentzea sp. NBRC 105346]
MLNRRQLLVGAMASVVVPRSGYDVVVVGAGAAGLSAALGVKRADPRASVLLLEAQPFNGGTSIRSGGWLWIPNNADMRAAGLADPKDMALRYMARLSHPEDYDPGKPLLGLSPRRHAQLDAYYEQGSDVLDWFRSTQIMPWEAVRGAGLPLTNDPLHLRGVFAPDYHPELAENVPKRGRSVVPKRFDPTHLTEDLQLGLPNSGSGLGGVNLIAWLTSACLRRGVHLLTGRRVLDLVVTNGRVTGVETAARTFTARRGVVFTSGGFSKNAERLAGEFRGDRALTGGGCAVTSAQGDLVRIAERHGFALESMDRAWFIQNLYEQYKIDPDSRVLPNYLLFQNYWSNGDSMFMVNRRGVRVVNEKTNYHDRTQVHFQPDNRFLLSVFDQHTLARFVGIGGHVTPMVNTFIGPAASLAQLRDQILARFAQDPATSAFGLAPDFTANLAATLERFNGFARSGRDLDFHRGEQPIDVWWHGFCLTFQGIDAGPIRDCVSANTDSNGAPYPNPTMRPLAPPYYAVILSSGLQDTNGGPAIDECGRILDARGRQVPGLYGAGNCVASPAGHGYWGAGGTLGPAVVFGHIAGRHCATSL